MSAIGPGWARCQPSISVCSRSRSASSAAFFPCPFSCASASKPCQSNGWLDAGARQRLGFDETGQGGIDLETVELAACGHGDSKGGSTVQRSVDCRTCGVPIHVGPGRRSLTFCTNNNAPGSSFIAPGGATGQQSSPMDRLKQIESFALVATKGSLTAAAPGRGRGAGSDGSPPRRAGGAARAQAAAAHDAQAHADARGDRLPRELPTPACRVRRRGGQRRRRQREGQRTPAPSPRRRASAGATSHRWCRTSCHGIRRSACR